MLLSYPQTRHLQGLQPVQMHRQSSAPNLRRAGWRRHAAGARGCVKSRRLAQLPEPRSAAQQRARQASWASWGCEGCLLILAGHGADQCLLQISDLTEGEGEGGRNASRLEIAEHST